MCFTSIFSVRSWTVVLSLHNVEGRMFLRIIKRDLERSCRDLIVIDWQYLPGENEKSHFKISVNTASVPAKFWTGTSWKSVGYKSLPPHKPARSTFLRLQYIYIYIYIYIYMCVCVCVCVENKPLCYMSPAVITALKMTQNEAWSTQLLFSRVLNA